MQSYNFHFACLNLERFYYLIYNTLYNTLYLIFILHINFFFIKINENFYIFKNYKKNNWILKLFSLFKISKISHIHVWENHMNSMDSIFNTILIYLILWLLFRYKKNIIGNILYILLFYDQFLITVSFFIKYITK